MSVHHCVLAAIVGAIACAAPAEPSKAPVSKAVAAQPQAPVLVASATKLAPPAPVVEAQTPEPARKARTARVGSCRCGGQTPTEN